MEDPAAETVAEDSAPRLRRSVENRGIAEYINLGLRTLETARENPDIAEKLYPYGMDDEDLAIGMRLAEEARTALHAHLDANQADKAAAIEHELTAAVAREREAFATYRGIARAAFTGLSDRLNLKLVGEPPEDLQRFINAGHASYMAASSEPYTEKLTKRGYPPQKLGQMCESLDALAEMGEDQAEAEEASEQTDSTSHRDDAYNAFKEFMKEFKGIAKTVFRREPEQLEKLGI